ncbi:hypothetical protein JW813_06855 [Clostridium botulinum]|uniref:hypothetical protein n=1 Tax=Clostridium botulinum TaxID=1491 RepID=UPI0022482375|nr:hypothetical protein [Clostridium botulinum]UZP04724.1 hypothetical protein JW813_06855 [Clostridium botulinum]UZP08136.1 hypothetical protein JYA71_07130 [Clostridium botulinum]UZP11463.1 hypothetical protein JYA74_06850 [Clostridium botulinum]
MDIPKNDKITALDDSSYIIKRNKNKEWDKYYDVDEDCLNIKDIFLLQKGNIIYDKIMRVIYKLGINNIIYKYKYSFFNI